MCHNSMLNYRDNWDKSTVSACLLGYFSFCPHFRRKTIKMHIFRSEISRATQASESCPSLISDSPTSPSTAVGTCSASIYSLGIYREATEWQRVSRLHNVCDRQGEERVKLKGQLPDGIQPSCVCQPAQAALPLSRVSFPGHYEPKPKLWE